MDDLNLIHEITGNADLEIVGDIVRNPSMDRSYFIPVAMKVTVGGRRNPSGKLLADIRKEIATKGMNAQFILIADSEDRTEEGLRHSLISTFPTLVRNSFLSTRGGTYQIWLETKRTLDKEATKALRAHTKEFAKYSGIKNFKIFTLSDIPTPTKTELLTTVRQMAPITIESMVANLQESKLEVPSIDWLVRQLDALRRSGLLIRTRTAQYTLTLEALRRLGTSKGRRSRDVTRLLALARRRR